MFTRRAQLQLVLALICACGGKTTHEECDEGEYKTLEGDCAVDEGDGGGGDGGGGVITIDHDDDDPPDEPGETGLDTGSVVDTGGGGEGGELGWEWSDEGLTLTVPDGGAYRLGMAETDPTAADPWTGEDCNSIGVCHEFEGTVLRLTCVEDPADVVAGETTWLCNVEPDTITYFLTASESGDCWVWGHDVTYYAGTDCSEL